MLVEFSVGNYRSLKEIQTLSMTAANLVSKSKEIDQENTISFPRRQKLLKTKALYGANGSGKSNLLQAFLAFQQVVANSVKDDKVLKSWIEPHLLSTETEAAPTFFQMIFLIGDIQYRYGFEATTACITAEWLFATPGKREVSFFTREGDAIYVNPNQYKEASKFVHLFAQAENEIARSNALLLTTMRVLVGGLAKEIGDFLAKIIVISGLTDHNMRMAADIAMKEAVIKVEMAELLRVADTGILDIERVELREDNADEDLPEELANKLKQGITLSKIVTTHRQFDAALQPVKTINLSMRQHESEGSQKMYDLSPYLIVALINGRILIVDEFDARFHPILTRKIVQLFHSSTNKAAQLIFATHDTNLLDGRIMRRDQVCFVEKDRYGASHSYTLAEFKGVRNDASFEKDYIAGRYGAIPFLGDFEAVFSHA
jgi:uncharacterized protein